MFQKMGGSRPRATWLLGVFMLMASGGVLAQTSELACGSLQSHYGPFDYRTHRGETLDVVERFHFTPEVEALVRGKSSIHIGQDLNYTLGAFPNHHRALMSLMRLGQKLKTTQPPHAKYSVECFLVRALRFRPDDHIVRLMFARFLIQNERASEARHELARVAQATQNNPFTHYNLGLIYLDLKDYEQARSQAHQAMALGLGQTALRDRLMAVGQWQAPQAPATPSE